MANAMLSQLSDTPGGRFRGQSEHFGQQILAVLPEICSAEETGVGARRFELRTSSLSATRSNQLSYAPNANAEYSKQPTIGVKWSKGDFHHLAIGH